MVITIIGILVVLLLPAVNAAREAAKATQCRQTTDGLRRRHRAHHEQAKGYFPSGGWGAEWVGVNQGFGYKQPGNWAYSLTIYGARKRLEARAEDLAGQPSIVYPSAGADSHSRLFLPERARRANS